MNGLRRIVVGIDGSDASRTALQWAFDEAVTWGAALEVVHAWDIPFVAVPPPLNPEWYRDVDTLEESAQRLLDHEVAAVVGRVSEPPPIEKICVRNSPAAALLDVAKGASLLVVGSRGHGGFRGLLLGSVSQHCAQHASCPVVVVHGAPVAPEKSPGLAKAAAATGGGS